MVTLVIGGSGSGKSEYAEGLVMSLGERKRIYIATMKPWDEECRRRIIRHRNIRAYKQFETVELYKDLDQLDLSAYNIEETVVLLECMSNLLSNELYGTEEPVSGEVAEERVFRGFLHLKGLAADLIIVTNEVFSDGENYSEETNRYRQILGAINRKIASCADRVVEVVAGIPCIVKEL